MKIAGTDNITSESNDINSNAFAKPEYQQQSGYEQSGYEQQQPINQQEQQEYNPNNEDKIIALMTLGVASNFIAAIALIVAIILLFISLGTENFKLLGLSIILLAIVIIFGTLNSFFKNLTIEPKAVVHVAIFAVIFIAIGIMLIL